MTHMVRKSLIIALTIAVVAGCGAGVGAPTSGGRSAPVAGSTSPVASAPAGATARALVSLTGRLAAQTSKGYEVLDLATGKTLDYVSTDGVLSPDQVHYYTVQQETDQQGGQTILEERTLASGTVSRSVKLDGFLYVEAFDPLGRYLFLHETQRGTDPPESRLVVWDLAGWKEKARSTETMAYHFMGSGLKVSPDGRWAMEVTGAGSYERMEQQLVVYDLQAPDLHPRRVKLPLESAANLFDVLPLPDSQAAYVVAPARRQVITVNLPDAKVTATQVLGLRTAAATRQGGGLLTAVGRFLFPVAEAKRLVHNAAALSADGRRLYLSRMTSEDLMEGKIDGLLAYDTATWRLVAELARGKDVAQFQMTPDGKYLAALVLNEGQEGAFHVEFLDAVDGTTVWQLERNFWRLVGVR